MENAVQLPRVPTANFENFSLQDYLTSDGATLLERVGAFTPFKVAVAAAGSPYFRTIEGPPGPRVRVRDFDGSVRSMVMMGANDYLGLASDPAITAAVQKTIGMFGVGVAGPPHLNGMNALHRQLEQRLAEQKKTEDALLFASGYQTHLGWVQALLRTDDVLVFDELNHASLFDGIKLARANTRFRAISFRHNDLDDLRDALVRARERTQTRQIFVVVEGVYSMDGDLAPLPEIVALCESFGASLIVDDAHGTGVMGATGAGTAEHFGVSDRVTLSIGTFSKVFGVTGGFIAGPQAVIDYLRYFARSYMFSGHLSLTNVAAVLAGLDLIQREPERLARLHQNADQLKRNLLAVGYDVASESAILPIRVSEHCPIRELGRQLHHRGLFVNCIEFPAVPRTAQRIRISIMSEHSPADLSFATDVLRDLQSLIRS